MYKEKIITLIATRLSEANCERIWESVTAAILARESIALAAPPEERYLAVNKDWEERLHPRRNDGKFTFKGGGRSGGGTGESRPKAATSHWGKTPAEYVGDDIRGLGERFNQSVDRYNSEMLPSSRKDGFNLDPAKHIDLSQSPKKILKDIIKSDYGNNSGPGDTADNWADLALALQKRLGDIERVDKEAGGRKTQDDYVKEFYDCEDEIDEIEERWYDENNISGPLKFGTTDEGKKAKKRYAYLKRRRDTLDRKIDWSTVPDPDDQKDESGQR